MPTPVEGLSSQESRNCRDLGHSMRRAAISAATLRKRRMFLLPRWRQPSEYRPHRKASWTGDLDGARPFIFIIIMFEVFFDPVENAECQLVDTAARLRS